MGLLLRKKKKILSAPSEAGVGGGCGEGAGSVVRNANMTMNLDKKNKMTLYICRPRWLNQMRVRSPPGPVILSPLLIQEGSCHFLAAECALVNRLED